MTENPWPAQVIFKTIDENPGITIDEILKKVAATPDETRRYLRDLVKSGDVMIDASRRYKINK